MTSPRAHRTMRWWTFRVTRGGVVRLLLLVLLVICLTSNLFWRMVYPIPYYDAIMTQAAHARVDPLLVAAVASVESKYKGTDISHAGAVGLMQLMPDTAKWIARRSNIPTSKTPLDDPTLNLKLGSLYLAYLIRHYGGNVTASIAAYNAGPNKVDMWLAKGQWNGQLDTLDDVPIGETRHFVQRVSYNYHIYQRVYKQK